MPRGTKAVRRGTRGHTHTHAHAHTNTHADTHTQTHTHTGTRTCVRVCVCESVSVAVSVSQRSVRVLLRSGLFSSASVVGCAAAFMRTCGVDLCVCARACACARACLCRRAFVRTCERGLLFHRQASSRMWVQGCAYVCVCMCAPRRLCGRCGGMVGTGGINSSAGGAGRPHARGCGSVRSALGVARVRRQV